MAVATEELAGPSVLENLSDEECALAVILADASGLDLAEFCFYEAEAEDGCFRAWPYQWSWWRSEDPLQIDQCSRSVGKSLSIKVRGFAFPFVFPGQEMVVTAPELVHLEPITNLIENQFYATRLGREMLMKGRSAITHRPFMMNFANGSRIIGRIPQRDGRGVKGVHPIRLELDEAQDYPTPGWTELVETLKRGSEGAQWRAHGVTRGMRDKFFEYTQERPDNEWRIHRFTAMHRPNWTDQERIEKIKQYGSREDPDYRRNVLGLHGDATNPLFVLHRLMRCVDDDESSSYNSDEYVHIRVKDTELEYLGQDIVEALQFPESHRQHANIWVGMDVGLTADPSEILVFSEYHPDTNERREAKNTEKALPKDGVSRLKCICRISLQRISNPDQVRAILWVLDFYKPKAFALDKTGIGLPLYQDLMDMIEKAADEEGSRAAKRALDVIKGYNFSEKVLVDLDEAIEYNADDPEEAVKEAGIARNVLEWSTDMLRAYVDNERLWLPYDRELIGEFSGQTFSYSKGAMDAYGRRRRIFSEGKFHALDAARMAVMGHAQHSIETFINTPKAEQQPVFDAFVSL